MSRPIDVARARAETRACDRLVHFNNAGASLMPVPVSDALHRYLHEEERIGGYETAAREEAALERLYDASATLLGCARHEIAFVENATRGWDLAFHAFELGPGDRVLTTLSEYGSNVVAYLQRERRDGIEVVFVPDDGHGQIDLGALADAIDDRVKLISLNHIPTGGGLVNPVRGVGRIAREAGVPFLLDSCQGVGQIPIDVADIGCDVLSTSGRKYLRGPRGTGLLYVSERIVERLEPPMIDQHAAPLASPREFRIRADARRFECWEQFLAGKAALAVAIDYALGWGLEAIGERVYALADRLRDGLTSIGRYPVADLGVERCGLVTFAPEAHSPLEVKTALAAAGINVSVSRGSGSMVPFRARGLESVVRASVHYFNTEDEVDRVLDVLDRLVPGGRR